MPKINSLEVVHQDTNKDSYQNLHDILVELNKSLALNQEVVNGDIKASIENLLEMYTTDKEAFLRSVQTLTAAFHASEAKFEEEILLQASALEALARRTSIISAQTENSLATVTEYAEAVASEVERKTTTYTQDTAPTENLVYGDLWIDTANNNKMYSWNGIVWVDVTKVPTYKQDDPPTEASEGELWMDTNDNNKMYRWDGSAWVAVDDLRIAKSYARWGVNVDVNGHVAGIQLNADDTGTSEFTVLADNFRVYKSGYLSSPMFTVGPVNGVTTVSINGNLVVDGTIRTKGMDLNAATVAASSTIVNSSTTSRSTSFTISGLGAGEEAKVHIGAGFVGNSNCTVYSYINGVQLSVDSYTSGQLAYVGSPYFLGNGTHTATVSTNQTDSLPRRLSIFVIVSKR